MIETPLTPDIFRERLRELYVRYHGFVWRVCKRYVQNPDDADDLAHDVILKATRGWGDFAGSCDPATWLYRVAANHCLDHLRQCHRRERLLEAAAADATRHHSGNGMEELVPRMARVLETLRTSLGTCDQRLVSLRFERGLKQEHIARLTGISRVSIAKRLLKIQERAARLWEAGNRPPRH